MASSDANDEVYWLFQLAQIAFQYSVLMIIGAAIVYTVKKDQLCPPYVKSFPLIQWFVHGRLNESSNFTSDAEMQQCDSSDDDGKKSRDKGSSNASRFDMRSCVLLIYCFAGLQFSFLTWGVLQEKIMTTGYVCHQTILTGKEDIPARSVPRTIRFRNPQVLILISRIFAFIAALLIISLDLLKSRLMKVVPPVEYVKLITTRDTRHPSNKSVYSIAPFYKFSYCSLSNVLSSWCQYEALKYVNFPTQVLSKACKLIPVMIMSHFVSGKRYKFHQYNIAILISIGISFFLIGNHMSESTHASSLVNSSSEEKGNSTIVKDDDGRKAIKSYSLVDGLVILSLYLTFDSFTSNWQEKLNKEFQVSPLNMMASVNFYSCLFTFSSLASQALILPTFDVILSCDELLRDCIILSASSVAGQLFIYYTISKFGALTFTFIMTVRQSLAILLSCFIYGHALNILSYSGVVLVFTAAFLQLYFKWKR